MIPRAIGLLSIAMLAGCSASSRPGCPAGSRAAEVFTLYFGQSIANRPDVTDAEWQAFVNTEVAEIIPAGWTTYDAAGGWFDPATGRTIQEATKVLTSALPDTPDSANRIGRLRAAYQTRFKQKLVGMTIAPACASF